MKNMKIIKNPTLKSITYIFLLFWIPNLQAITIDPYLPDASTPPVIAGKSLVWNDEFNVDGKPNTANWKSETGFVRNQELQYYQLANANCIKGVLVLNAKRDTVANPNYNSGSSDWRYSRQNAFWTSGSIISQGKQSFLYGQFEIRARIDTTLGSWPAIWTKGISGSWPNCGETDIMEFYIKSGAKTILANVAWGSASAPTVGTWNTKTKSLSYFLAKDADWCQKFHVWKEIWNKDSLKLYLDNELLNTQLLTNTNNATGISPANPHQQAHFFLLNLAIGANGGTPRLTTSNFKYEVDYIRVYQNNITENQNILDKQIKIYPNPVIDYLNVQSQVQPQQIKITDIWGNTTKILQFSEEKLSLSQLKSGVYMLEMLLVDGSVYKQPILKK